MNDQRLPDAVRRGMVAEARQLDEREPVEEPAPPDEDEGKSRGASLFPEADASGYRARWQEIQADFVDDPRHAVERADELVGELMSQLTESFARERAALEGRWDGGDEASTEDLRVALRRYRSFFGRLLSL
jgi:CHAD domain-containing protein